MTIFQILKADHQKISSLLEKLEKTTEESLARRERLFEHIKREMITHARAEEIAVYSELRRREESEDIAYEALEEHALVDHLIDQLSTLDKSEKRWTAKMSVLKEIIEHHVEEEESEMFKKMRKILEPSDLKEMARNMSSLKKKKGLALVGARVMSRLAA